jgi:hypothetical protein
MAYWTEPVPASAPRSSGSQISSTGNLRTGLRSRPGPTPRRWRRDPSVRNQTDAGSPPLAAKSCSRRMFVRSAPRGASGSVAFSVAVWRSAYDQLDFRFDLRHLRLESLALGYPTSWRAVLPPCSLGMRAETGWLVASALDLRFPTVCVRPSHGNNPVNLGLDVPVYAVGFDRLGVLPDLRNVPACYAPGFDASVARTLYATWPNRWRGGSRPIS